MVSSVGSYTKGIWAERLSAFFLVLKGYRILEIRYKTSFGEVDIVAKKGRCLVFSEVKYRKNYEAGAYAISSKSQKRILRAAEYYLCTHKMSQDTQMRFDAIILSPPFSLRHIMNAWTS